MPDDGLGVELPTVIEAESIDLAVGTETLVASAVQMASCCDVWYRVPSLWVTVVIRLYGRIGAARALLRQVTLSRAHGLVEDGELTGIAMSIRGRPVTAFELTCQSSEVAVTDGAFYLSVWQSSGDLQSSGGDEVPETSTSGPLVTATLLAHDADTGELRAITTDSSGRLIMANPTFSEGDQELLDDATDAATPSTLVKRDGSAATRFTGLFTTTVDHDTPTPGALSLGTGSGTTSVVVGKASGTTTLWNATFEGTTTVIDSTSLQVSDRVITINRTAGPSAPVPTHIAGISVMRGDISGASRDFAGIFWDESAQAFRTAFNTSGDDSTLGSALPLIASELRGPTSAPAVIRSSSSSDAVQLSASTATLLSVSDASGITNVDPSDRPLLIGAATAGSGAGHSVTVQAQQARGATAPGNLTLAAGKGGTPGTNVAGDIIFDNGQLVSGVSGFNRWQAAGTDYLTMQQTAAGPSFISADGCQLIMKASGSGTTLNANTGNLNLYGNALGTLYAAALTLGGSTVTLEDASLNHTVAITNVRSNWTWAFDALCTNPTFTQTQASSGAGQPLAIKAQQGQNVVSGANNNGGDARLVSGAAGTGGTGGAPGSVVLAIGTDNSIKVHRVVSANVLEFANTFVGAITVTADTTTTSITGQPLNIAGANATASGSVGGNVGISGGAGGSGGGGAVQITGGAGTALNAPGGEIDLVGGAPSGTGKQGNISLHVQSPSFQGGGAIVNVGNATAEPTGAPSGGLFLWSRNGALVVEDSHAYVGEVSPLYVKSGGSITSLRRFRRADTHADITTATTTAILTIPAADLPGGLAGSAKWGSTWTIRAIVFNTSANSGVGGIWTAEYRASVKRIATATTSDACTIVGTAADTAGGAVSSVTCTISSNSIVFNLVSTVGSSYVLKSFIDVEGIVFEYA